MTGREEVTLVTGGAGFIGCALAPTLLELGRPVVAVDVLHPQVHPTGRRPERLPEEVELVVGDVTDADVWTSLLARVKPRTVVHLAAETGTGQSLTEASRHALVNVVGTTRMLDALVEGQAVPEHFVLTSSRAVYGDGAWRSGDGTVFYPGPRVQERLELGQWAPSASDGGPAVPIPSVATVTREEPSNVYGATKLAQEHILRAWCSSMGASLSVLRLQNVYGPGQSPFNAYTGIVTLFARLAANNETIDVYEDGRIGRDFVYIDDVVTALAAAVRRPGGTDLCVDVGSGQVSWILDVARFLARRHGAPEPRISGGYRLGDVRHAECSIEALERDLGIVPQWTLEKGLSEVADWMRGVGRTS